MAISKATTTEDLTASAKDAKDSDAAKQPYDQVAVVSAAPSPKDPVKYSKVKSVTGAVTEVPESIVDALKESGYTATK